LICRAVVILLANAEWVSDSKAVRTKPITMVISYTTTFFPFNTFLKVVCQLQPEVKLCSLRTTTAAHFVTFLYHL